MKKISYLFLVTAGICLASCSHEEIVPGNGNGEGNFSVEVTLPKSISTRDFTNFGEGYEALKLQVAVYDQGDVVENFTADFPEGKLTTTVDFNLAKGKSYQIAFFAQSQTSITDGVYTFNANASTISVAYENMKSESNLNDAYDCFLNVLETGEIGGDGVKTSVILNRPVGQVNWGTSDLFTTDENGNKVPTNIAHEKAYGNGGKYIMTNLTVTKPYTSLNFLNNTMTQASEDVVISSMAAPYNFTFPLDPSTSGQDPANYVYVAMTYLLAPSADPTTYDLNLDINNSGNPAVVAGEITQFNTDVEVSAAPVQANYQTNIYGNLLSENVTITVTKNPKWMTPDYKVSMPWDGTYTYPTIPDDPSTPIEIATPSDLAGLAQIIDGTGSTPETQTPNPLAGYTVNLESDMDLNGMTFPGFGSARRSVSTIDTQNTHSFKGVFDGNNHTISNFVIEGTDVSEDAVGLFPNIDGEKTYVKNLVIENITINAPNNEQASVVGILSHGANISNVKVTSGTISSAEGAAGIVGRVMGSGNVTGCDNYADISITGHTGGGIAGAAYYTTSAGITIENCNNYGKVGNGEGNSLGGIVGVSGANIIGCTNEGEINGVGDLGGIVGYQNSCGSIKDCTNNANITASGTYVGGILGWAGGISYSLKEIIEVSGNTNTGTLNVPNGIVGGIMSINRCTVNLSNNTNSAPSITGGSEAAGIVAGGFAAGPSTPTGGDGYINYSLDNTNNTLIGNIHGTKTSLTYTGVVKINDEVYSNGELPSGN